MNAVLVVEPDHNFRVQIRSLLEKNGYYVVSATNGVDALTLSASVSCPSIILLSKNLPMMNAEEFLSILMKNENYKSVPVIHLDDDGTALAGACCSVQKSRISQDLLKQIAVCLSQ